MIVIDSNNYIASYSISIATSNSNSYTTPVAIAPSYSTPVASS